MDSWVECSLHYSRSVIKKSVSTEKRTLELKLFALILVNFKAEF